MEIIDCETLVAPFLKNKKFVSCTSKNFLSSGENYGSTLLAVDVKVIGEDGEEEILRCVAKKTPPTEMLWRFFNTKVTFKKEIAVYDKIVPTLNQFGEEKGVVNLLNFFVKCYGGRLSLNPNSTEVDHNAVLLLENLKNKGYQVGDRFVGFSKMCAEVILKDLAVFHATSIAYKLQYPEEFDKKLKPYLDKGFFYVPSEDLWDILKPAALKNPKCVPLIDKLDSHWKNYAKWVAGEFKVNEPYATITHNDLWTNNTMIKYENDKPLKNVIIDFQIIEYGSPAHDLLFFIYSSIQLEVLKYHTDDFINLYFDKFINTLKKLGCHTSNFTRESFDEEIDFAARHVQFTHVLYMLFPIMKLKEEAPDLKEINGEADIFQNSDIYHENFYNRLHFVMLDFEKRGWL